MQLAFQEENSRQFSSRVGECVATWEQEAGTNIL